jgi:hypothetical protein
MTTRKKQTVNAADAEAASVQEAKDAAVIWRFREDAQFRLDCRVEQGKNRSLLIWPPGVSRRELPIVLKRDLREGRQRGRKTPLKPLPLPPRRERSQGSISPLPVPVPLVRETPRRASRKQRSREEQKGLRLAVEVGLVRSKIDAGQTLKQAIYEVVGKTGSWDERERHGDQLKAAYRSLQRLARR